MAVRTVNLRFGKYLGHDFTLEFALRELIDNAKAAGGDMPRLDCPSPTSVIIADSGAGLTEASFDLAAAKPEAGHHGMGLKDALAVLIDKGATITMSTANAGGQPQHFAFELRQADSSPNETIHLVVTPLDPDVQLAGTTIHITNLPKAEEESRRAQLHFLEAAGLTLVATADNLKVKKKKKKKNTPGRAAPVIKKVDIYNAALADRRVYVNGMAMHSPNNLSYSYNIVHGGIYGDRNHKLCQEDDSAVTYAIVQALRQELLAIDDGAVEGQWPGWTKPQQSPSPAAMSQSDAQWQRNAGGAAAGAAGVPPQEIAAVSAATQLGQVLAMVLQEPPSYEAERATVQRAPEHLRQTMESMRDEDKLNQLTAHFAPGDGRWHKRQVDSISEYIKDAGLGSVDKVFPSGSYGRGTTLGELSDVDLIVVLNNLKADHFPKRLPVVLSLYEALLKADPLQRFKNVRATKFAVKCDFVEGEGVTECDLLLIPEELHRMKHDKLVELVGKLNPQQQRYYSAVFARKQVELGRHTMAPPKLTNLARLVKRWSKLVSWPEDNQPNAYCMELVLIKACQLEASDRIDLVLRRFFALCALPEELIINRRHGHDLPAVTDPANPYMNTASGFQWDKLKELSEMLKNDLSGFFHVFF